MLRSGTSLKDIFNSTIAVKLEAEINSGKSCGLCYVEEGKIRIDNHSMPFCLKICIIVSLKRKEKMQTICGKDRSIK